MSKLIPKNPHDEFFKAIFSKTENTAVFLKHFLPRDVLDALDGVGAAAVIGGIIWYILAPKHNTTVSAYFNGSSTAIGVTHAF